MEIFGTLCESYRVCVCGGGSGFKWYNEIVKRLIYSGSIRGSVDVDGVHVHSSCTGSPVMVR